ncbi:hypothetical protein [Nonomuraea sp. JJY05]|uniref:hypothetical protein n=1 Tax=Nonomuraea sp. JJY05 TaxID=3350255 RepID=UPI00373DF596
MRDTLADVDDERLPELARQWAGAAEAGNLLSLVEAFVGLARRAREADELLYCWMCM